MGGEGGEQEDRKEGKLVGYVIDTPTPTLSIVSK